jgi:nucleoid DNA-binding protein
MTEVEKEVSRRAQVRLDAVHKVLQTYEEVMYDTILRGEQVRFVMGNFDTRVRVSKPAWHFGKKVKMILPSMAYLTYTPNKKIRQALRILDDRRRGPQPAIEVRSDDENVDGQN